MTTVTNHPNRSTTRDRNVYVCRRYRNVGPFEYSADFSQASSPVSIRFLSSDDFDWQSTPFQVADCRHDRHECERMLADYFR